MHETFNTPALKAAPDPADLKQLLTAAALTLPTTAPARNTTTKAHTTHQQRKARTQTAKRDRRRNRQ